MRKILSIFTLILMSVAMLQAQNTIDIKNYNQYTNIRLKLSLQDADSDEPIAYATVYLIPQNDTLITNFAVSDEAGEVEIKDIIPGRYQVNAEMIGYHSYKRIHNLKGTQIDLGVIKLEENPEDIDPASITAIGNAIAVKNDTLIYNTSAFRVGENAMLEDLLKKMPGMEVAPDGTVMVNGEKVDKITIGGKTFFFNDPAMAVKNLPAKVVERIKVVDKKTDEAEFSGVSTKDEKEKVMDLELKSEYQEGWFGNAKLHGGFPIKGEDANELSVDDKALFNASAMAAYYNEADQITLLANGKNVDEYGGGSVSVYTGTDDIDSFAGREGIITSAQAGVNYNTERIGGMEMSSNVAYNYSNKDAREKSHRTSFQSIGSDIETDTEYNGIGTDSRLSANIILKNKDTERFLFNINPTFYYTARERNESYASATAYGDGQLNSSQSSTFSHTDVFNTRTSWSLGVRNLGKDNRSLTFSGNFTYRNKAGNSTDYSTTDFGEASDIKNLMYGTAVNYLATEGILTYVEPISTNWSLQTRFTACYISQGDDISAFNGIDGSANDNYSSYSRNQDFLLRERLLIQYEKDNAKAVWGLQIDQENVKILSRSLGVENITGKGDWTVNFAPYADVELRMDNAYLTIDAGGRTEAPIGSLIIPTLNVTNPTQITTGNIYLKTGFQQNLNLRFRRNNPKTFSYVNTRMHGGITHNGLVYASWFDDNGVRYAVPVNSKSPAYTFSGSFTYRRPLNKKKTLTLSINPVAGYSSSSSYQAKTRLPGLDKENFDYGKTMDWFWGDADGSTFYSGESGFAQSMTNIWDYSLTVDLQYEIGNFSLMAGGCANNIISRYSLDSAANNDIWTFITYGELLWYNEKGWEVMTDYVFNFYRGLSKGFGAPEYIWNARLSKELKSFTVNLSLMDILNQRRSYLGQIRKTSAEYMEDSYHNVMGRCILLGVSFNFGKMNAKNNSKVQSAIYQMAY